MIVVHHLENSRSQRVLWLLEELGVPYRIEHYKRNPTTMLAPPELLAVHPLGKSPVITDEDLVVAESGAIIEYLVERHGQGRLRPPEGSPERLRYTYWLHFAEGSAMPPLVMKLVTSAIETRSPWIVRPVAAGIARKIRSMMVTPNIERQLAFMESELRERPWFAGAEFSAADIQMSFPLEAAAARGGLDTRFPRLQDFLARIHARPAYERAIEAGGPYRLLG
ncbi:MAG: glutathione S-transferase [Burkholderiaceae bacterium]